MANTTLTNIAAELTQVAARLRDRTVKATSNRATVELSDSKGSLPLQLRRGGQQFVIYVAVPAGKTAVEAT